MDEVKQTLQGARAARLSHIFNGFSNAQEMSATEDILKKGEETEEVSKEEEEENPFYKAAEEAEESEKSEEVEKSDVFQALEGSANNIKVTKTGKEIKEQVEAILPDYTSELAIKKAAADEKIKECGNAPTRTPDEWWTNGLKLDCGYKIYSWDETYIRENSERSTMFETLSASDAVEKKGNVPENQAQAQARRDYNDAVRQICEIVVDIKALEILKTIKDETEFELTPRQIETFKF